MKRYSALILCLAALALPAYAQDAPPAPIEPIPPPVPVATNTPPAPPPPTDTPPAEKMAAKPKRQRRKADDDTPEPEALDESILDGIEQLASSLDLDTRHGAAGPNAAYHLRAALPALRHYMGCCKSD